MVLSFSEYRALKDHLLKRGLPPVHLVDACGGQYFTVEQPGEEMVRALRDYFADKGARPDFTTDLTRFILLDQEGTP